MLCNQILQIFQTISDPTTKSLCFMILKMILTPFLVSEVYLLWLGLKLYVFEQILSYRVFSLEDYNSLFNVENNIMLSLSEYLFCHRTILLGLPLFTVPSPLPPFIHILLREDNVLVRKGSLSFSLPSLITKNDQIPFSLLTAPNEDSLSCIHLLYPPPHHQPAVSILGEVKAGSIHPLGIWGFCCLLAKLMVTKITCLQPPNHQ